MNNLSYPEGLKELMADISREVLRAQPEYLYRFIADYLSALLVTRENMIIAASVCEDICKCGCDADLDTELRDIGLTDDEVAIAKNIILKYFLKGEVKEYKLMRELASRISIEDHLPSLKEAIRIAFLRHQRHADESSIKSDGDTVQRAVKHTIELYQATEPTDIQTQTMAQRIQAAYRSYGVRRYCSTAPKTVKGEPNMHAVPSLHDFTTRKIMFVNPASSEEDLIKINNDDNQETEEVDNMKNKLKSESSICIAGSLIDLPKYVPYSVYSELNSIVEPQVLDETEKKNIDYETARRSTDVEDVIEFPLKTVQHQSKIEELLELEDDDDDSDDFTIASY